jgi:NAD(P)-dependent dehydrogenase (short-subunit alcohol dehydrogenase family)
MNLLTDDVAIVTGAAAGQGRREAELFAEHGARVVLADVDDEHGRAVAEGIRDDGGDAAYVPHDVSDEDDWASLVETIEAEYGRADVLVNNAGVIRTESITDETVEGWQRVIDVDLRGVWLGMRHVLPLLIDSGGGSVVNVSSIYGVRGGAGDSAAYHAAKGGVTVLTKNAAVGYGPDGVRVNSIHPGYMRRPMGADPDDVTGEGTHGPSPDVVPLGRFGDVDEVARVALFLASDLASYVTGVELYVDGGLLAK